MPLPHLVDMSDCGNSSHGDVICDHHEGLSMQPRDGEPSSFFVFIVGNNTEWEDGREEFGDVALFNAYQSAGVPSDQICFVKDKKATKLNAEQKLTRLLDATVAQSIFVFYYGGHGNPNGFCIDDGDWDHEEIVGLIDKHFSGRKVILILDCCCSGNVCRLLQSRKSLRSSYLCITSSPPYTSAGPSWTMTTCWIRAIQCSDGNLPIFRVIAYMADEHAREKGDQLTVYIHGDNDDTFAPESCSLLPINKTIKSNRILEWETPLDSLPQDARITRSCAEGDKVFYRHFGGVPVGRPDLPYVMPVWLPATVISKKPDEVMQVQVKDTLALLEWEVETSSQNLLNCVHMASTWTVPSGFNQVQCELARKFKYIDCSIPSSTLVQARWSDGVIYDAITMDWREVDWEDYLNSICTDAKPHGPYVPVSWVNEDTYSVISLNDIIGPHQWHFPNLDNNSTAMPVQISKDLNKRQRDALLMGLLSCKKHLCNVHTQLGTSQVSCFWPFGDRGWYDAKLLTYENVPFEALASHSCYADTGRYCVVRFCEDGVVSTVPVKYVRRREQVSWWYHCCYAFSRFYEVIFSLAGSCGCNHNE